MQIMQNKDMDKHVKNLIKWLQDNVAIESDICFSNEGEELTTRSEEALGALEAYISMNTFPCGMAYVVMQHWAEVEDDCPVELDYHGKWGYGEDSIYIAVQKAGDALEEALHHAHERDEGLPGVASYEITLDQFDMEFFWEDPVQWYGIVASKAQSIVDGWINDINATMKEQHGN